MCRSPRRQRLLAAADATRTTLYQLKPKDLLEYVAVHEMLHLIEPSHGERFVELLKDALKNVIPVSTGIQTILICLGSRLRGSDKAEVIQRCLKRHYPSWREARAELNELPLARYHADG